MAQPFLLLRQMITEYSSDSEDIDMSVVAKDDVYKPKEGDQLITGTQAELNYLTRDQDHSKYSA